MNLEITTQYVTLLPPGCSARAGKLSDYLAAFDLVNAYSLHINGQKDLNDPELIHLDWQNPGFDPETDIHVVHGPDGRLVGLIECWLNGHPPIHPWNWICVHPDYLESGLWEYLLNWGHDHSLVALERVPLELRVAPRTGTDHTNLAGLQSVQKLGWKHIRSYYRMLTDLESTPVVPAPPKGIVIRPYNPATEAEAVYLALNDAFKDHFGYVEQPFEHGFAEFKHNMIDVPNYDPAYWFLAVDGSEIAGVCLCIPEDEGDSECGWVNELCVRRAWRKQGLGFLLLKHAFAAFYAVGKKRAGLGVDATNLTGALRLYERAGMHVQRQFDQFEKEFRPGRELSTQELE